MSRQTAQIARPHPPGIPAPPKLTMRLLLAAALAIPLAAQTGPANLDFEQGEQGQTPPGCFVPKSLADAGHKAELWRKGCYQGAGCVLISRPENPPPGTFANLMQGMDATPYRGKRIVLRAAMRVDALDDEGCGQLWLRVDRTGGRLGLFHNMDNRPSRSAVWRVEEISGMVEADATRLKLRRDCGWQGPCLA
ncbi:MAG: hypothetical protein FJW20_18850 [Acidimicrobiia bacterium]|nr:hypothetical protein [Acidimicrobiia bacterium]